MRGRARHLEGWGEQVGLARVFVVRYRHRHDEPIRPDGDSLRQPEWVDDGLAWLEEAERGRASSGLVGYLQPSVAALALQLGFAEGIGIEQRHVAQVGDGDVYGLARQVRVLYEARGDASPWTGIVRSQRGAPRCNQCEYGK